MCTFGLMPKKLGVLHHDFCPLAVTSCKARNNSTYENGCPESSGQPMKIKGKINHLQECRLVGDMFDMYHFQYFKLGHIWV